MTLGQEFHAFAVTLREEIKSIKRCQELLLEVNLEQPPSVPANTPPSTLRWPSSAWPRSRVVLMFRQKT